MTPAERSNSPPIISRATGTAMIPMVEAEYRIVLRLEAWRKVGAAMEKKTKTATAPTTAPSSGRPSSLRTREVGASRSSTAVAAVIGCPA